MLYDRSLRMLGAFALLSAALGVDAADPGAALTVSVMDRDGAAVDHVVVYVVPDRDTASSKPKQMPASAVMAQRDGAFVPHILVVETGAQIEFPNTDVVSHHVYSFSPAKRFELPLYKGNVHAPLTFDTPGTVTLGCNIHDGMLGYILVVDTPHFALSNDSGEARLENLAPGAYRVHVWTPRIRPERLPAPVSVSLGSSLPTTLEFRFSSKLFPPHAHEETSLSWDDY